MERCELKILIVKSRIYDRFGYDGLPNIPTYRVRVMAGYAEYYIINDIAYLRDELLEWNGSRWVELKN